MRLITRDGRYIFVCSFPDRLVAKQAGFRAHFANGKFAYWYTTDRRVALRVVKYADAETRERLMPTVQKRVETKVKSRAVDAEIEIPCPDGLAYYPFQRAGIAFAAAGRNTLIADEMGLGKTVQVAGVINLDPAIRRVLVICPASLKLNWRRELNRWLTRKFLVIVADPKSFPVTQTFPANPTAVIVNYDILHKHARAIRAVQWDLLAADECHYLKNARTRRAQYVIGSPRKRHSDEPTIDPIPAKRILALTGTPIVNRPVELWPIIHWLDPDTWSSFGNFTRRYCGGHHNGWGYDATGGTNLEELQDELRSSIMVRRLKSQVLTDLPAKVRQVIEIDDADVPTLTGESEILAKNEAALEALRISVELAKASDDPAVYKDAVARLRAGASAAFTEISKIRHETALAKVPYVVEHLREIIRDEGKKVVCFAHHHDVIAGILTPFAHEAVSLTGEHSLPDRQRAVDAFQSDDRVRLFVGSITAAGVGITLTSSSHVVFAELDWVPGNMSQAEDRCHRIGQTDSVLVQHIVLAGSIDATMARTLVNKQDVIDRALDKEGAEIPVVPGRDQAATESVTRSRIEKEAADMDPFRIAAVHRGLRVLAGMCDGAVREDGAGFSRLDTEIGHRLAELPRLTPKQAALGLRLVTRYRRQVPDVIVDALIERPAADLPARRAPVAATAG